MKPLAGHLGPSAAGRSARPTGRAGAGYTLVELMIALGILGVGMAMIGTLFSSGMIENKRSVRASMSTLIAENAAVICRASLRHAVLAPNLDGELDDISLWISEQDRIYPSPTRKPKEEQPTYTLKIDLSSWWYREEDWIEDLPDKPGEYFPAARYGWMVAARLVIPNWNVGDPVPDPRPNDYQIVIVPYKKFTHKDEDGPGNEIQFTEINITGGVATGTFDVGAPVIYKDLLRPSRVGEFAYILNPAGDLSVAGFPDGKALTLEYKGAEAAVSPAIGCYVVRTGLSP